MTKLEQEQPLIYKTLMNMVNRDQLPHALIFYGDRSTSKKEMVKELVKMAYAHYENVELYHSSVDHRIDNDSFTNLKYIEPSKNTVTKDQVLDFVSETSKTSLEDGPRFYCFTEGDLLNVSSSNSLLKFIEEPIEGIHIIFLVENISSILQTIKSRCSLMGFRPLNKKQQLERMLEEGYDKELLTILIEYTQDKESIDRILNDEEMIDIISIVKDMFSEPFEKNGSLILALSEHYNELDTLEKQDFFMSLFISYLEDILKSLEFDTDSFIFITEKTRIKTLAKITDIKSLSNVIELTLELKSRLRIVNVKLQLDNLLVKVQEAFR